MAELELRRTDPDGLSSVPWELVTDPTSPTGRADPVADAGARTSLAAAVAHLAAVVAALQGTLTVNTGLTTQTDGLTNTQLRATPVGVADGHPDPQTDGLTNTQLRAAPLDVADRDDVLEVLAPQVGADAVATFTFTASSSPWVAPRRTDPLSTDDLAPVRITSADQTPTASFGVPVDESLVFPLPLTVVTVRVWIPAGVTVTVYGTR